MAQFMCMMLYWHHFRTSGRRIVFNTNPEDTLAKAFLKMLAQCTESEERNADTHLNPLHVRVLDVALILYAEHDLSSSTFAARIAASTLTDFHSAVCVGISTIRVLRECARVWAYTFFLSLSLSLSLSLKIQNMLTSQFNATMFPVTFRARYTEVLRHSKGAV